MDQQDLATQEPEEQERLRAYDLAVQRLRSHGFHAEANELEAWTNKAGQKSGWDRMVLQQEWSHTWKALGLVPPSPYENPTEAEIDLMVEGYRHRLQKKEPQSSDPAYLHGYRNSDYDHRGTTEAMENVKRMERIAEAH